MSILSIANPSVQVFSPQEVSAFLSPSIIRDITTTRQMVSYGGALWVSISYRLLPGATAVTNQFLKVVVNAASDADAAGKLATDGNFIPVCQGDDIMLSAPASDPITRLDFITEQAVGAEKTIVSILAGI